MFTGLTIDEIEISIAHSSRNFHDSNFNNWSNRCSLGIAANTQDSGKAREHVYSRHKGVMVLQPSSLCEVEFYLTSFRLSHDVESKLFSHNSES